MNNTRTSFSAYFYILLLYAACIGIYYVARYDLRWAETDTSSMTRAIESVHEQGTYLPADAASTNPNAETKGQATV